MMRLELTFYDYSTNDHGILITHPNVRSITKLTNTSLRVMLVNDLKAHIYDLSKLGDLKLVVCEN